MARHNDIGKWGEQMAVDCLTTEGWIIRERNWRLGHLEVDIIAQKDNVMVFVEVKARAEGIEEALEAVDRKKRRNMALGADKYLQMQPQWFEYRFDIIAVDPTQDPPTLEHIPDAFESPLFTK